MEEVDVVGDILRCGAVFYTEFEFIDKHKPSNDSRSLTSDLFSIASTVIEIDDLGNQAIGRPDLINRIYDSIFRGRRDHILACIAALLRAKMLEQKTTTQPRKTVAKPKPPTSEPYTQMEGTQAAEKVEYRFSATYFKFLEDYTNKVYKTITGMDLSDEWLVPLRLIFDFYKFRYIPEWFLLMRRILRASGLAESAKGDIRRDLFSGRDTWTNINQ